ncbi:MAG TPA: hypothetical protein VGR00_00865 [Thermoanaerobaculia bacterium]|jgi:hypothetical protein|nr:hypothetical protein [Thermoanaerobaculia bacterium]
MTRGALDVLVVTAAGQRVGVPAEQIRRLHRGVESLPGLLAGTDTTKVPGGAAALDAARGSFGVEAIGDLMAVPLHDVMPLPAVLSRHAPAAFFGAAVVDDGLLLLVDLDRLSA